MVLERLLLGGAAAVVDVSVGVIAQWVSPDYASVFQAAFNLVVLLLSLAGLGALARRRAI